MILGVDHLALSCENLDVDGPAIVRAGFEEKFRQYLVPNSPGKRPFLVEYRPEHSVGYYQTTNSVAIELTQHGTPLKEGESGYQVLLSKPPEGYRSGERKSERWKSVWKRAYSCASPQMAVWPNLQAQFWYDSSDGNDTNTKVKAVLVPVPNLEEAETFWNKGLGCHSYSKSLTGEKPRWSLMGFVSPAGSWSLDVILAESSESRSMPRLDQAGFPCLALLTTSIKRDARRIWNAGAEESTGEFQVEVNGKPLRVAVFRGPDGNLIELIEFQRQTIQSS